MSAPMAVELAYRCGGSVERVAWRGEELRLGRGPECNLRIDHRSISRLHCVFKDEDGRLIAWDQGSRNGVIVNGTRIGRSASLRVGDVVKIGAIYLYVLLPGAPLPPHDPPARRFAYALVAVAAVVVVAALGPLFVRFVVRPIVVSEEELEREALEKGIELYNDGRLIAAKRFLETAKAASVADLRTLVALELEEIDYDGGAVDWRRREALLERVLVAIETPRLRNKIKEQLSAIVRSDVPLRHAELRALRDADALD